MTNYKLNVIPSPIDERDLLLRAAPELILPEQYDPYNHLFPVRDQGQEGSCSAYTAAAIKEWQEYNEHRIKIDMSTSFIYSHRHDTRNEGMTPRETMEILYNLGSLPKVLWKEKYNRRISIEALNEAAKFKISGYGRIYTVEELKASLFNHGIGYFAIPVYNYTDKPWRQAPGEVLQGGHAITVVAWTKEGFVLRNSWGSDFGDGGYMLFPYEDWGKHMEVWFAIDAETKTILSIQRKMRRRMKKAN